MSKVSPHQPQVIKLKNLTPSEVDQVASTAAKILAAGGIVIYPTETVYGVGVDATNPVAVLKVLKYKSRREGKPLSIAVTDQKMAEKFVDLNDQAKNIYQRFLPGPVTVVSADLGQVAPGVASEFATLGIRISSHPLVAAMVEKFGRPITATSANASGKKRPYTLQDIFSRLSAKQLGLIDLAIDAGTLPPNQPSTVIDTTLSTPLIMRQGELMATNPSEASQSDHTSATVADFKSTSATETSQIAGKWLLKYWDQIKTTGLIIGLNGSLGAGKTVLTQGVGQFLQIPDQIVSPTYNYILEYDFNRHGATGKLQHLDAWKINNLTEYQRLDLPKLMRPGTLLIIEWWTQIADFCLNPATGFVPQLPILVIDLEITGETDRNLKIQTLRPSQIQPTTSEPK